MEQKLKFELYGIAMITVALLCLASLFSSAVGVAGQVLNQGLLIIAGNGRYLLPLLLIFFGLKLMWEREEFKLNNQVYGLGLLLIVVLSFMHLSIPLDNSFQTARQGEGGGLLGAAGSYFLQKYFGLTGTYIILSSITLACIILVTGLPLYQSGILLTEFVGFVGKRLWHRIFNFIFEDVPEEDIRDRQVKNFPRPVDNQTKQANTKKENSGQNVKQEKSVNQCALVDGRTYQLPSTALLDKVRTKEHASLDKEISEKIRVLEETLTSFGINARITQVSVGPAITRYEIQPPAGVKVSRIVGLADDIALSLAAPHVRIEAPIPGKAAVGIEVPNREISTVHLRELLESKEFNESLSKLTVALGKDIAGAPIITDLVQMPHLLVAGATGSGKSVCINNIVTSILFKATPDEVKFLMIDPKMVELTNYNGIPHLISPVVTNPKKAAAILQWAVKEMERRYEIFALAGVRDVAKYNAVIKEMDTEKTEQNGDLQPLPFIVIIIDELADLMMIAPSEVEDCICRLAQMARAAGIHLVIATQRPSVDVITGLIKANIPSRISFAVSSQMDSRTILDMGGAEKLLGRGDMLFFPVGAPKPVRVQGAFLSDRELEKLVTFLKEQVQPEYDKQLVERCRLKENEPWDKEEEDELLPQAVQLFIEKGNASISMLQRRLHIGYARAARLVDIMEQLGIVGSFEGSKPRAILMTKEQFQQTFRNRDEIARN